MCTTVNITDDTVAERVESFTVSLISSNNELQPLTATVTIRDNDGTLMLKLVGFESVPT